MKCKAIIASRCPNNHKITRACHDKAAAICHKCEAEARAARKRQERNHELDQERQAKQQAYAARLAEIEDEIEHQRSLLKNRAQEQDRQNALAQKTIDLANLKKKVQVPAEIEQTLAEIGKSNATPQSSGVTAGSSSSSTTSTTISDCTSPAADNTESESNQKQPNWDVSEASDDWEEQKELWGAKNEALDSLMNMIG